MARVTPLFDTDEDQLDREQSNGRDDTGAGEFLQGVMHVLSQGPTGVRSVRLVARTLEDLAQAVRAGDEEAIGAAYQAAHEALQLLTS